MLFKYSMYSAMYDFQESFERIVVIKLVIRSLDIRLRLVFLDSAMKADISQYLGMRFL